MTLRDGLAALLVMALWGFNFVAAKVAVAALPPLFLMMLRFALVAALLLPFALRPPPRRQLIQVAILAALLGSIHFPLIFAGVRGIDAATASIAVQLQVPFSSLLAAFVFKDFIGWRRAVGMAVAFAGVVIIAGAPGTVNSLPHLGMVVAAGFAFSVATVQIKRIGAIDGVRLNAWMALLAVPQLALLTLLLEDGQMEAAADATWAAWAAVLYTVVASSIVAYGIWYRLARIYPVNQTAPFLLTLPMFGVLSGIAVLGEPVTLGLVVGGAMTIAGVGVIMIRRPGTVSDKVSNPT